MGQTLCRAPAACDVPSCASLLLGLGGGCGEACGRTDRLPLPAEVHLLTEPGAKSPSSPLLLPPPTQHRRRSCDRLRCPGEGRCVCPSSVWWLGGPCTGPLKPQQGLMEVEVQPPTGYFTHCPVPRTDSLLLRSQEAGVSAQDRDRAVTMQTLLLVPATSQKSTEDPLLWPILDHAPAAPGPPRPPSPSVSRQMRYAWVCTCSPIVPGTTQHLTQYLVHSRYSMSIY